MFALEPPVDDLSTSRGVVLSRAATILRSIETQPLTGGCLGRERYRGTPIAIVQYRAREKSEKCTGEEFSFSSFKQLKQCQRCTGEEFSFGPVCSSLSVFSSARSDPAPAPAPASANSSVLNNP